MARKRVCRLDLWLNPAFDERLQREADIALDVGRIAGPADDIRRLLQSAHVYHVSPARNELPRDWFVNAALLTQCPNLLCVSSNGAGHDTIDVAACTAAGVAVVNQIGANAASVAEFAIGLMLTVSRKIALSDQRLRRDRDFTRETFMGHEISGKVLGLVGIGHTGRRVAALARAFGMEVLAYDPMLANDDIAARGATPVSLDQLIARADIVSLHCPLDDTTRGMFDASRFAAMKRGSIFVTTARGGIHDEAALADALRTGHIAGAGLDVWDREPPPLDHPLLALDTVVATHHTAGVSHEARRNVAAMGAEQIVGVLKGERPPRLVNPEVWPGVARRIRQLFV